MCGSSFILLLWLTGMGMEMGIHLMGIGREWDRPDGDGGSEDWDRPDGDGLGMGPEPQQWGGNRDKYCPCVTLLCTGPKHADMLLYIGQLAGLKTEYSGLHILIPDGLVLKLFRLI